MGGKGEETEKYSVAVTGQPGHVKCTVGSGVGNTVTT